MEDTHNLKRKTSQYLVRSCHDPEQGLQPVMQCLQPSWFLPGQEDLKNRLPQQGINLQQEEHPAPGGSQLEPAYPCLCSK